MDDINHLIIVQYRARSEYNDEVGKRYHFPRKYFNQLTLPDIRFIYFEPKKVSGEYFGYGEIGAVTPDPDNSDQFFAEVLNYRDFPKPVSGFDDEGKSLEAGPYYNPQNAVRRTSADIFSSICKQGGIDLEELGTEPETTSESEDQIVEPFDPTKIKVDREPMSVFQVLRKIQLGEIILHPDFQRNLVWDPVRRSRLIESTLLRIPLPAFYFDGIDANRWSVIDGLQRLSTFRDFISEKSFALTGMEYLTAIEGKRFNQLPRGMQRDIEETQVTLFIIRPETPAEVKFTIFYRINTAGLVLTAQEIRHALFQGAATNLLRTLAQTAEFLRATDDGVTDIRMDARECVLRYLAFKQHSFQSYAKGDMNRFLSDTMKELNDLSQDTLTELGESFVDAMNRAHEVLGSVAFRKFSPYSNRRGPINKALFESWANVLQAYDRHRLVERRELIVSGLASMFEVDFDYIKSLSSGTGSPRAVHTRFQRAHDVVQDALG